MLMCSCGRTIQCPAEASHKLSHIFDRTIILLLSFNQVCEQLAPLALTHDEVCFWSNVSEWWTHKPSMEHFPWTMTKTPIHMDVFTSGILPCCYPNRGVDRSMELGCCYLAGRSMCDHSWAARINCHLSWLNGVITLSCCACSRDLMFTSFFLDRYIDDFRWIVKWKRDSWINEWWSDCPCQRWIASASIGVWLEAITQ